MGEGRGKLGLEFKKGEDFGEWYADLLKKAEMIANTDVSGCHVFMPRSYAIWEKVQGFLDTEFKKRGVQNCYFPMFITEGDLFREEEHIDDFAPEVAWVDRAGSRKLEQSLAIRPTSETGMYPHYAKWIRSHKDLPLKLNQWCNVVRWEFKNPTPFIRSREFLWQEGHTVYATQEEADVEVLAYLDIYARAYEEILAVPVVQGRKTEKERFAGGLYTTTVEAFIPESPRTAVQGATSHALGENFAKMFDITFEDETGAKRRPAQSSWGFTTRSLGVMVMVHSDDKGLVLPPRVAQTQVVIIPIVKADTKVEVLAAVEKLVAQLAAAGIRVHADTRDNFNAGYKFNHWELVGACLRLEVGARDLAQNKCVIARRDTGAKSDVALGDDLATSVHKMLDTMHSDMLEKARKNRDAHIVSIREWSEFVPALEGRNMILGPWCNTVACEESIKKRSAEESGNAAAKSLCIPFGQPDLVEGTKCFSGCGAKAQVHCLFGRSY